MGLLAELIKIMKGSQGREDSFKSYSQELLSSILRILTVDLSEGVQKKKKIRIQRLGSGKEVTQ